MKEKLKIIFLFISIFFVLTNIAFAAPNLKDAFNPDPGENLGKVAIGAGYDQDQTNFNTTIANVINAALSLVGVIFLALMVYGGFLWMTARGNEQQVEKAKNLIIAAIIGLVIVISAYAISVFVVSKLGQATLESSQTTP